MSKINWTTAARIWVAKKAAEGDPRAQAEMRRRNALDMGSSMADKYVYDTIADRVKRKGRFGWACVV